MPPYQDEWTLLRKALDRAAPSSPLNTPEESFDRCKATSVAVTTALRSEGFDARWINLGGPPTRAVWENLPENSPWANMPTDSWIHYVTEVDGTTIDFAFRQFDPKSPYPRLSDTSEWERAYDVTDTLNREHSNP